MQKLTRDGVGLAYEAAGEGAPPILLVHGWLGDHSDFAPQFEYFRRAHRVVAVDLRGHGQSDKPHQDYTMAGFADDLAWLCGRLGVERPVVVGHSMGGVIALELARRRPGLPMALVAVDSPIVMPRQLVEQLRPACRQLWGPDYREAARRFTEDMFLPTDDPERRARIVARVLAQPQQVMASACEQTFAAPSAAADTARSIAVPVLTICSAEGHMPDLGRLRELCPQLVVGQTVGAGHYHQLEVPEQMNAMIERFVTVCVRPPAGGA
jgi:pimeloyl-ACP methyl ester carboxylesterase